MCASKNIAMLMRVKYFYCDENMLLLVNLYVRILDITTNHICSFLQTLGSSTPLRDGYVSMRLGSGEVVSTTAVGVARLHFENNFLILNSVYFIPGFRRNLISISMLHIR